MERTIQTLEDMLWACVINFSRSWEEHLPLVDVAYNKSYNSGIGMAPYEVLYGRKCRTPLCWMEMGERQLLGLKMVQRTSEKIKMIQERMKIAQSRQKSYADNRKRDLEFRTRDNVYLKVSPFCMTSRGKK